MDRYRRKYNSNELVVNTKSNFKSHLVKCQSIMDNSNFDELVIKGIGKATTRAANLALQLNANNYNAFEIKSKTFSVDLFEKNSKFVPFDVAAADNFDPDARDLSKKTIRHVPGLEIIVRKNKLEIDKMKLKKGDFGKS